jgi:hypothetical protein
VGSRFDKLKAMSPPKGSEGRGDGPQGLQEPNKVRQLQITLGWKASAIQPMELGKPNAGKPPVRFDQGREAGGPWPPGLSIRRFPPTLHHTCLLKRGKVKK